MGRIIIILLPFFAVAQDTARVMTYNLLAYGDHGRDPYFRTVVEFVRPDILVVQEIDSLNRIPGFLFNVLNTESGEYSVATLYDGPDSDNALFFRSKKFWFLGHTVVRTALRHISEFTVRNRATGQDLIIYSVHLNAGQADSLKRAAEIDSLRKRTNRLMPGTDFLVVGDFNLYGSDEIGYRKLIDRSASGESSLVDPLSMPGVWNTAAMAPFHTQSTRVRAFGGGATGGLDDRFDMILPSRSVSEPGGIFMIPGSYRAVGNDGQHYNDSINRLPNGAVPDSVAMALHEASDHLPVVCDLLFDLPVSVPRFPPPRSRMSSVFPNPVPSSGLAVVRFTLPRGSNVRIRVYDLIGQLVHAVPDRRFGPGVHVVPWRSPASTGVYLLEVIGDGMREVHRVSVLR